ncbi:MAG: hypothetical protein WBP12_01775 [Candidatus Saccharimonas sp.]
MPIITNSAEGGSNNVVPTTGNTGGGSGTAATSVTVGTGNALIFSDAYPSHGSLGYQFDYGTTAGGSLRWNISESGRLVYRFYIRISELPTAQEYIAGIRNSSGFMCIACIGSDGKFIMQNAAGTGIAASRATNTFPLDQQVRLEIAVTKGTTTSNGTIEYAYYLGDSASVVYSWSSSAQNTGTTDIAQVVMGRNTAAAEARTIWYDTMRAETLASGWIGAEAMTTTLINTAEGGTNGVTVSTANTGGLSGNAADTVTIGSGNTIIFSNANPAHGTLGYEMNYSTTAGGSLRWNVDESSRLVHSFYVKLSTLPTAQEYLGAIRNSGGNMCIACIGSDGKFIMQNAAGTGISASRATNAFPVDQFIRIEIAATKGTTTGNGSIEYAYYLGNGTTPLASWSSNTQNAGTTNVAQVIIGRNTAATEERIVWYDTIRAQALNSGWIGPYSTQNTLPVAELGPNIGDIEPFSTQLVDGSASSDSDGGSVVQYTFRQISGPAVSLSGSGATRTYKAPGTLAGTTVTFGLIVTDDQDGASSEDTVVHTILKVNERAIIGGVQVPIELIGVQS